MSGIHFQTAGSVYLRELIKQARKEERHNNASKSNGCVRLLKQADSRTGRDQTPLPLCETLCVTLPRHFSFKNIFPHFLFSFPLARTPYFTYIWSMKGLR